MTRRPRILFKIALAGIVVLAFSVIVGTAVLRQVERSIAFRPEPDDPNHSAAAPKEGEEVWFFNKDGNRLHGWFFPARVPPARATIIHFHGNGGNIKQLGWLGTDLASRNLNVLVFDYRGYGRSRGELGDEAGLYQDADAAYEFITHEPRVSRDSIVLYGQSLGTTAATDVAARHQVKALILESGPSSASDMAKVVLPWLPETLHSLAKNRFDSAGKLSDVHCRVLIVHGDADTTVPVDQARKLYAAAHDPKQLVILPGAGHNIFGRAGPRYLDLIAEFAAEKDNLILDKLPLGSIIRDE